MACIRAQVYRESNTPEGPTYTTIMELGPQNHNRDGLLGPNSIIGVYMDPLGTGIRGCYCQTSDLYV